MSLQPATTKQLRFNKHIELYIMAFIFMVLFLLPVLFTRVNGAISWLHVLKIWKDHALLLPIFALNHWLLVPKQLQKQNYLLYFLTVSICIGLAVSSYYYFDEVLHAKPQVLNADINRPTPVPPYAELLMYSVLLVGVDAGLLFSKKWHETEEKKHVLEKKNSEMQLEILKNQVSPHFFMNTLNNIYALIEMDTQKARDAVMKLSKLMRYMLYENENGKVLLSKEFEFIKSYVDLMRLRYTNEDIVQFSLPSTYEDTYIPVLLFISYIENAFKYGASSNAESQICIKFEIKNDMLHFYCFNNKQQLNTETQGGIGTENSKTRLDLLYGNAYVLEINSPTESYNVTLTVPLL